MDLSVVTTLYRSAPHLREFYARARAAAEPLAREFEIVLVNDGSPDDSQEIALQLCAADPRVRLVELSRNFGHHKAMMTGLAYARGRRVFLIDCDLEEEPELLGRFHRRMRATGADVVYGVQTGRKGGLLERLTGQLFYRLFNLLSSYPVPPNLVTARLMRRRYVRSLVRHRDREVFMAGLWAVTGFRQVAVPVRKHSRPDTTYGLVRKLALVVNAVTAFSSRPLAWIFYLGCLILALSGGAGLYLIARRLFFGGLLAGWASLIVSVWFLGGLSIFCLGIIGIYLAKMFSEVKRRPYTVVRKVYGRPRVEGGHAVRKHSQAG
jgi:putative glycosyltransferase